MITPLDICYEKIMLNMLLRNNLINRSEYEKTIDAIEKVPIKTTTMVENS